MSRYERNVADPDFDTARDEFLNTVTFGLRPLYLRMTGQSGSEKSKQADIVQDEPHESNDHDHTL